jgi:hypothetical protein
MIKNAGGPPKTLDSHINRNDFSSEAWQHSDHRCMPNHYVARIMSLKGLIDGRGQTVLVLRRQRQTPALTRGQIRRLEDQFAPKVQPDFLRHPPAFRWTHSVAKMLSSTRSTIYADAYDNVQASSNVYRLHVRFSGQHGRNRDANAPFTSVRSCWSQDCHAAEMETAG